jgi:hypothetical protein
VLPLLNGALKMEVKNFLLFFEFLDPFDPYEIWEPEILDELSIFEGLLSDLNSW